MDIVKLNSPAEKADADRSFLVTAIKPAIKTENRVNIFINDKYDFSLEISQVVDLHLKVKKRLSASELEDCRRASQFGKLYCRTLEYTLTRPHSEKEIRDYLLKRRQRLRIKNLPLYTDQDIAAVISRLKEKGYLDDEKFACYFVENRYVKKGISKKRLILELKKKGISTDVIENVLADSTRSDDAEIQKIINKKFSKYTPDKLIAYLVRQGFDYQQSKAAVLEMDLQNSEQNPLS